MSDSHAAAASTSVVSEDAETRVEREKTLKKMKWGPIFNTAARICGMLGGPLWSSGLLAFAVSLGTATAGLSTAAIAMVAVGGTFSITSIAIDYVAHRSSQDCSFDQMEVGAHCSAKYLVQELKKNDLCLSTTPLHEENARKDGKSWQHVVKTQEHPEIQRVH